MSRTLGKNGRGKTAGFFHIFLCIIYKLTRQFSSSLTKREVKLMELNIYEKNEIIKTYKSESYEIKFGVVEDIIELFDFLN